MTMVAEAPSQVAAPGTEQRILSYIRHPIKGFRFWFEAYVYLNSKDDGRVKASLWDGQSSVVDAIEAGHTRIIVLKGRQLGISWLLSAYALWHAMYFPYRNVLVSSQGQAEAQEIIQNAQFVYNNLPAWQRVPLTTNNAGELEWRQINSRIRAVPSTEKAGRSQGTTLVIADEWAYHPYAEANWSAMQPTLGAKALYIGLSTANGRGNLFHAQWEAAQRGETRFHPVFVSWRGSPGRSDAWYDDQRRDLSLNGQAHLLAQEHPDTPEQAFIASGACKFDVEAIHLLLKRCRPPKRTEQQGALKVWVDPEPGLDYVVFADVALGLDREGKTSDACAAAVYSRKAECVATLHGRWEPVEYAAKLHDLGTRYNTALLAVENNGPGAAVLVALKNLSRYTRLYRNPKLESQLQNGRRVIELGWKTTVRSKGMMIGTLQSHISGVIDGEPLLCYDREFFNEALSFVDLGGGRMGAQPGLHDDRVVAHAGALELLPLLRASSRWRNRPLQSALRVVA